MVLQRRMLRITSHSNNGHTIRLHTLPNLHNWHTLYNYMLHYRGPWGKIGVREEGGRGLLTSYIVFVSILHIHHWGLGSNRRHRLLMSTVTIIILWEIRLPLMALGNYKSPKENSN
jgi:hypothetical protein